MGPISELTDRYRLETPIASGGMGEVWRAMDQVLGRPVAVKLLWPEYTRDEVTLARFRAEAQHAGLLSHPGIAQVYGYRDTSPACPAYLVMELVDGPSLAAVLEGGPLEPRRAADVIAQAAAALDAAHSAGVLHRDIKPGNLLIRRDGQVKVTDFGISQSDRAAHLTRTGMLVGTMGYLAPERVSGQAATPAADLYGLGIVGWECLAGQPPFRGEPLQVALAHRDQPLPGLPAGCLDQPGGADLAALITELTAKDPAARPGSAADVAVRASRIRDGLPGGTAGPAATATAPLPAPAPGRRQRRGPFAAGIVTAVLVAAGLMAWLLAGGYGHQAPPATTPSAQQQGDASHSGANGSGANGSGARRSATPRQSAGQPAPSSAGQHTRQHAGQPSPVSRSDRHGPDRRRADRSRPHQARQRTAARQRVTAG